MNFFKSFIHFFISITTAIVFIISIVTMVNKYEYCSSNILVQILGAAAITSLITTIIWAYNPKTKLQEILQTIVHYILLCICMVLIGIWCGWINQTPFDMAMMCLYVAGVYVMVFFISYLLLKKEADEFNKAINRRRNEKGLSQK